MYPRTDESCGAGIYARCSRSLGRSSISIRTALKMAQTLSFLLLLTILPLVHGVPTPEGAQTFNVSVPEGFTVTNRGNYFCVLPASWFSVMVFYLGNYAAHAATLITYPGEPPIYIVAAVVYALFFPTTGIVRGLNAVFRHARFPWGEQTDMRSAARAGALCMVVRTPLWRDEQKPVSSNVSQTALASEEVAEKPQGHSEHVARAVEENLKVEWKIIEGAWCKELPQLWPFFDTSLERPKAAMPKPENRPWWRKMFDELIDLERKVHGTCVLPDNGYYALAYVPRNANVETAFKAPGVHIPTQLSSTYSFIRAVIAVIQVLYASATLLKATRGPQIKQYGFAAFGLTVIPYLIMSVINLVGNVLTPDYNALYIVDSPILQEAKQVHGAKIDGIVGSLVIDERHRDARVDIANPRLRMAVTQRSSGALVSAPAPPRNERTDLTTSSTEESLNTAQVTCVQSGHTLYCIAFTCPVISRTDYVPPTKFLESDVKSNWKYFDPKLRAEVHIPAYTYIFFSFVCVGLGSLTLIPVGVISRFHENNSTHEQRVWIVSWTVFGIVIGTFAGWWTAILDFRTAGEDGFGKWVKLAGKILFALFFAAPGVGGFIMVGQMLREYGNCVSLS
ncbi:hypothetical protein EJ06DRAFT_132453 [Trichodelitschia bisporula]|uniref:Uncharacterized protein n=1 Tax=Trichodelitschia bisporula TaxID=703511 RepID=A0A6G1HP36_9PEZI|nr:hypothetical protein EJ06DRAFT_132453 [Trichodelitschia bisporula]